MAEQEQQTPEEHLRNVYYSEKINERANELIEQAGDVAKEPVEYTHELWFSKAKTVLPFLIAQSLGIENQKTVDIAAAVDVLWTLSVMVDDIYDNDQLRRSKPAAWTIYGKAETYRAAEKSLAALLREIATTVSPEAANLCKDSIDIGLGSIERHKKIGLGDSLEALESNYQERDRFFSATPLEIIGTFSPDKAEELASGGNALETYYLGGQIGNDLDDLFGGAGRKQKYSDIRSGLVTIPIKIMWDSLDETEKAGFLSVFGKGELTDDEQRQLGNYLAKYDIFDKSIQMIQGKYEQAQKDLSLLLTDNDMEVFSGLCQQQLKKFSSYGQS